MIIYTVRKHGNSFKKKKNTKFNKMLGFHVDFMSEKINVNNFKVTQIQKDGNCFYLAVSREIVGIEGKYAYGNSNEHTQNQSCTDGRVESWATEAEIFPMATEYANKVCVLVIIASRITQLHFHPMNGIRSKLKIFLRLENEHFDNLRANSSMHVQNQSDNCRI